MTGIVPARFAPHEKIAEILLPHVADEDDPSHDVTHVWRVWRNAMLVARVEGGDTALLTAAAILHDCVNVPKDHPDRAQASRFAADRACTLVAPLGWRPERILDLHHVIVAHSHSAGVAPRTLEARILQDADRLDGIGAIGIARCFAVSGLMKRGIAHPSDPLSNGRPPDDQAWALDHFKTKLLGLAGTMNTLTGRRMARERHQVMERFVSDLVEELSLEPLQGVEIGVGDLGGEDGIPRPA